MKCFVLAITLTCALSASTLAGEMHTTGAPAPAPAVRIAPDPGDVQAPAPDRALLTTIILTLISLAT
jgi:hypothetical protein